jgi:hypothetical protein
MQRCQTPTRSRISRLAWDSAIGRSGACRHALLASTTTLAAACSSSASAQPTGPAPRTDNVSRHRRFNASMSATLLGASAVITRSRRR